jgi:FkbM family methyltransferase
MQEALIRELKPGNLFFDVGANGGFFSILACTRVGAKGKVVGFEAHPEVVWEARQQLRLNHCDNATVVAAAVSDRMGTMDFSDASNSFSRHLLTDEEKQQKLPAIRVPTITLDAAAERYGAPDVIKIDIEGAELLALQGGSRLLRQHRPTLLLEIHDAELSAVIREVLDHYGYQVFHMDGTPLTGREYVRYVIARRQQAEQGPADAHMAGSDSGADPVVVEQQIK